MLLLDPGQPATEEALDAARRASLVDDHRLARIFEVGSADGAAYVVAEPARGTTLEEYVADGPIDPEQARAVVGEAAAALESARRHGVRHLALDARSVRVTEDGEVLVTGTGVANALGANLVLTPARASRKDAGDLVDLLYLALTGRPVTSADGSEPPAPSSLVDRIPPDLDDLCIRTHEEGLSPSSAGDLFHTLAPWGDIDPPRRTRRTATQVGAPPPPPPAGRSTVRAASAPPPPPRGDETEEISAVGSDDGSPASAGADGSAAEGSATGRGAAGGSASGGSASDEAGSAGQPARPSSSLGHRLRRRPRPPSIPPADGTAEAVASGTASATAASAGAVGLGAAAAGTLAAGAFGAGSHASDAVSGSRGADPEGAGPARDDAGGAVHDTPARQPHEDGRKQNHSQDPSQAARAAADEQVEILPNRHAARLDAVARRVVGGARPPVRHARVAPAHLPVPDPDASGAPSSGSTHATGTGAAAGAAAAGTHAAATGGTAPAGGADAAGGAGKFGARASAAAAAAAAGIGNATSSLGRSAGRARSTISERLSNPGRLSGDEVEEQPLEVPYGDETTATVPVRDARAGQAPPPPPEQQAPPTDREPAHRPATAYQHAGSLEDDDSRGSLIDDRLPPREAGRGSIDPMPWVVGLFLVLLALGGWWAASTLLSPTTAVELPSEEPPSAGPAPTESPTEAAPAASSDLPAPVLDRTELVDPEGGGTDNADTAADAADGDPDTYWRTLSYQSPTYGVKSGSGLLVWLEEISSVSGLTIDTFADGEGGHVEIRVSDPATPGEGQLLAEGPLETGETEFTWDEPVATAHLIVWVTELPTAGSDGANRAEIAEITVR